ETAGQRRAVAAILRVGLDSQPREARLQGGQPLGGGVATAVVDDDDLEVVDQRRQRRIDRLDRVGDDVLLVVGWQNDRDDGHATPGGRARQRATTQSAV